MPTSVAIGEVYAGSPVGSDFSGHWNFFFALVWAW